MRFHFTRRLSLVPGLRLNLSKSGASLSIGHGGLWVHGRPPARFRPQSTQSRHFVGKD